MLIQKRILIDGNEGDGVAVADRDKKKLVILKNYGPFADCISETNNTQVKNAKDLDEKMEMYILLEYRDNYSKRLWCLWQCFKDEPNANLTDLE